MTEPTFWNVILARFVKSDYTRPTLATASGISIFRIKQIFGDAGKDANPSSMRLNELQAICDTLGLELTISIKNATRQAE